MPIALALSHLDDAAFSCGGLLAGLARDGWRVVMATLFTGSVADPTGFALACQLDKGLAPEVDYMALRRDEDVRAAAALGIAPPVHLPFREAPHRGYGAPPELFSETRADDGIAGDLAPALADLIAAEQPDLILAPRRSAAMSITSRRSGRCAGSLCRRRSCGGAIFPTRCGSPRRRRRWPRCSRGFPSR